MPVTMLKISRTLVRALMVDHSTERTLRAITAMATALGIRTAAVGVETEEQLETLRACGVDFVQGFLFGKPASAAEFEDWHRKLPEIRARLFKEPAPRNVN
jgi:EAL domain-containing protein (putative c-di-GMP-specific phosphodiesterase class I)